MDSMAVAYQEELRKAGLEKVDDAVMQANRGNSTTEYTITGSLPSVFKAIELLFQRKPAFGYGTMVHTLMQLSDGNYAARMSHSNSCD